MSILFVLLMFLLVISISYFHTRSEVATQPVAGLLTRVEPEQRGKLAKEFFLA